jgi:hypothetical protein
MLCKRRAAVLALIGACGTAPVVALENALEPQQADKAAPAFLASPAAESADLERRLQRLSWAQFKRVIFAIPKLKASVDAYGPLGWEYVRANYATYPWKKNIARLDASERHQLAELIERARMAQ